MNVFLLILASIFFGVLALTTKDPMVAAFNGFSCAIWFCMAMNTPL
jgi:hypothetical protein